MSLAAALKKGMAAEDGLGDWDPFKDEADRPTPPARKSVPANVNRTAPSPAPKARQGLRAVEPGGQRSARPAPAKAGKQSWLSEGIPSGRVNAAQFVRELERFAGEETKRAVKDAVLDVSTGEIEGVARLSARIKGRYFAKLLDLGNPSKSGIQDAEVRELTRYRETYEELVRGLDMLKTAIEAGDIAVSGMVRR